MAKFKIELQLKKDSWMLLTDFDSSNPSKTITFNEQLEEGENDSYSLSFDMPEFIEDGQIRTGSLIAIGRVLRLTYSKPERKVWFVIKNFSIGEGRDNFIYSIEAQDYAGYIFARNNLGLNLNTTEDEDFWEWMKQEEEEYTKVSAIGNYILERGWLRKKENNNFIGWTAICNDKTYQDENLITKFFQYNISVSESNTYNALVELANTSDTFLRINYETKVISFIHRDNTDKNLDKNYTLREDFNILESSVSYSGEEMYSIFYVSGGTDENDEFVILSDETEYKDNFLYDFGYYKEKGLITQAELDEIEVLFKGGGSLADGFTRSLAEINDDLQKVIKRKYFIEDQINKITNQIRIDGQALLPSGTVTEDYPNRYEKLVRNFQAVSESEQKEEKGQELQVVLSYKEIQDRLDTISEWKLAFPFSLVTGWGEKIEVKNNSTDIVFPAHSVPGKNYCFRLDFKPFEVDPNPQDGSINSTEVFWNIKGKEIHMGWIEGQHYIDSGYPEAEWDYDRPDIRLGVFTVLISSSKTFELLKFYYPYYEKMIIYDGMRKINIERQKIEDQIDFVKNDWIEAEKGLIELENLDINDPNYDQFEADAKKEGYLKSIEEDRLLIGDYLYDEINEVLVEDEEDQRGYLTLWKDLFEEHFDNFLFMFNADENTIESKFGKPVMESYRELMKEKQDFWFEIKKQYGNNIFSEGYYNNEIETSSLNLKDQADLIYKQHKQPNEDFTISYINVSDVIGVELNEILVGDYIKLNKKNLKLQEIEDSVIQVSQISRELRKDSDISLSISRYNIINKLLEKIVAKGG